MRQTILYSTPTCRYLVAGSLDQVISICPRGISIVLQAYEGMGGVQRWCAAKDTCSGVYEMAITCSKVVRC